ncbi:hypothetical protein [Laceyella putida]|uniref:DUF2637 domain-containing protein n=1 Tax=Laceyella putida TaxID=110101 RepID=A0ABW2RR16_9BACL
MYHESTALKRSWFSRLFSGLGNIFLRLFNIICSLIVSAMNIYVSFNHTWTLFMSVGQAGNLALAATIGCELAFIQSSISMVVASIKRKNPGFYIWFVFTIGTGLVMWSNISATLESGQYWLVCVLLGLVPPVMMWGSKGILSSAIMGDKDSKQDEVKRLNEIIAQLKKELTELQTAYETLKTNTPPMVASENRSNEPLFEQTISQPTVAEPSEQTESKQEPSEPIESEQELESSPSVPAEQEANQPMPPEEQDEEETDQPEFKQEDLTESNQPVEVDEQESGPSEQEQPTSIESVTPQPHLLTKEQVKAKAIEYKTHHHEWPSIKHLREMTGCDLRIAAEVLNELKTQRNKRSA